MMVAAVLNVELSCKRKKKLKGESRLKIEN